MRLLLLFVISFGGPVLMLLGHESWRSVLASWLVVLAGLVYATLVGWKPSKEWHEKYKGIPDKDRPPFKLDRWGEIKVSTVVLLSMLGAVVVLYLGWMP